MNAEKRQKIYDLRQKGLGYKAISFELGVSVESIKSFCKRNHLNGYAEASKLNVQIMEEGNKICVQCKLKLKQKSRGRTRRFCSEECRRKWWSENSDKRNKSENAIYKYKCQNCDINFVSYGNRKRKFCSISCSIKFRFYRGDEDERENYS